MVVVCLNEPYNKPILLFKSEKMRKSFAIIVAVAFFICCFRPVKILAQAGSLDLSFNPCDIVSWGDEGVAGNVRSIAIQNNGGIIIGGEFSKYSGSWANCYDRIDSVGNEDNSWANSMGTDENKIYSIAINKKGDVFLAGKFKALYGYIWHISRVPADPYDATFFPGAEPDDIVRSMSIQSDDKIIIGGDFKMYKTWSRNHLARVNTDGTLDLSFLVGVGADNIVYSTSLQSDGKIIIGGSFTSYQGTARNGIARINTDGSLDTTFAPGVGLSGTAYSTAIQSDGKLVVGGSFTSFNGTPANGIVRLNTDGSLDTSFNPGTGLTGPVYATTIQSDGKIIIGGNFTSYNGTPRRSIVRINTSGAVDTSFDPGTGVNGYDSSVYSIAVQNNGKVIIGGAFTSYNNTSRNSLVRVNANGTLDGYFNPIVNVSGGIGVTAIQNDGKIIVSGRFQITKDSIIRGGLARIYVNGTLDTSFDSGTGVGSGFISSANIQSDGKIVLGGFYSFYNGTKRSHIARIHADGSLDTTFNPGTGADSPIYSTAIQSDGKIIIAGGFTSYNGTAINCIARINTNGTLDASFNPAIATGSFVRSIAIQSNGEIIAAAYLSSSGMGNRDHLIRIKTDGTIDTSFDPGNGTNGDVNTINFQNDGKIIIGGHFHVNEDTISRSNLVRINPDGTVDASFNAGEGADIYIYTVSIQKDGKIIAAGLFTSFNGKAANRIVRCNTDGSLDTYFDIGVGADNMINSTAIQSDGKIIIGGNFTSYNNIGRSRLARIYGDNVTVGIDKIVKGNPLLVYPNPTSDNITLELPEFNNEKVRYQLFEIQGKSLDSKIITAKQTRVNMSDLPPAMYFIIVTEDNKAPKQFKIVKR